MIRIIHGDITQIKADAIVNAANKPLNEGGGVCGAIYDVAGSKLLGSHMKAYKRLNNLPVVEVGSVTMSPAFMLRDTKEILHVVGPIYSYEKREECERQLMKCYLNIFKYARENNLKSIAIPCISTGIYGYPPASALEVVQESVKVTRYEGTIKFVCYSKEDYLAYRNAFSNFVSTRHNFNRGSYSSRNWIRSVYSRIVRFIRRYTE